MAGDWIAVRIDLLEDPAVIGIAKLTGLDECAVVGRLVKLWSWADRQTSDGAILHATCAWVDHYLGRNHFADAMVSVGWLTISESGVEFPHFDRWMSKSAKRRLTESRKKRLQRQLSKEDVPKMSRCAGDTVYSTVTSSGSDFQKEEDKEKEEKEGSCAHTVGGFQGGVSKMSASERDKNGTSIDESTPELLAQLWCFTCSRRKFGSCRDNEFDVAREFAAWVKAGADPLKLKHAIENRKDTSEYTWQLKERVIPHTKNGVGLYDGIKAFVARGQK